MAKKEIKKQTIEEILAEHTPTPSRAQSSVTTKRRRSSRNRSSSIPDCIIWDLVDNLRKIRAEEKRAQQCLVDAAKDAYLADPDLEVLAQASACPVI